MSRDTLKTPLTDAQIAALVHLDAQLHVTHITADVYYNDPAYLARWVRAIRAVGLHVWFRGHWYAWENHRDSKGTMTAADYIAQTRSFLQHNAALFQNGDIFDFCSEPENGAYWQNTFGKGWAWHNAKAKQAFNSFIRSGVYMASSTLTNRSLGGVMVTAISVNSSVATRLLSKPTIKRLGMITLDLYPEGKTTDPTRATQLLVQELSTVHKHWPVPILIGEHGYARDINVDDATQAHVLAAEFAGLARLPYLMGMNYWVDAGGKGYGGYTNILNHRGTLWVLRPGSQIIALSFQQQPVTSTR